MTNLVLHLEDDHNVRASFKLVFTRFSNYDLKQFECPSEVPDELYRKAMAIISDFDMYDETALDMLKYLQKQELEIPVIMCSGNDQSYDYIKELGLDKNIVFWADKLTPIRDIIIIIKSLKINGFTK